FASYLVFVDPDLFPNPVTSITIILYAVVGGMGSVKGPIIGAAILYPLDEILRGQFGDIAGLSNIVFALAIILVVLYAPTGISGVLDRIVDSVGAKVRSYSDSTSIRHDNGSMVRAYDSSVPDS